MSPGRGSIARSARLTRRGAVLATVGATSLVGAYLLSRPELLYVGMLALLLPVLAVIFARFRRVSIEVDRSFLPEVVGVGEEATVELRIANTEPVPTPELAWSDVVPWTAPAQREILPALAARRSRVPGAGSVARIRYSVVAPRRGVFDVGPLGVVLADPFGLATGDVSVGGTDRIVVTPRLRDLPETGLAILASDGARMLVRRAIGGDDDLSTREYRTGDAMRRVHWRATARHGELMVRQEERRTDAEARVILDTRRSGHADTLAIHHRDEPDSESFELALSLAASIALHLVRGGFDVEFIETGGAQLAPVTPLAPFLESLATVELSAEAGEYRPAAKIRESSHPDRDRGSVFAIVADADQPTIDVLVSQRARFDLAIAFVVTWRESASLEPLRAAGWTCVPVGIDDSVEGAWLTAAELHGARHGR